MKDWRNILIGLLAAALLLAADDDEKQVYRDGDKIVRLKIGEGVRVEGDGGWYVDIAERAPGRIEILPHVPGQKSTRVERVPATTKADQ